MVVISVLLSWMRCKGTQSRPHSFIKQAKRQAKAADVTLQICGLIGHDSQKLQPKETREGIYREHNNNNKTLFGNYLWNQKENQRQVAQLN